MAEGRGPFRSWKSVEPHAFRPGVTLRAIGGEQVLVCSVRYEAGTRVQLHAHEATEQVMVMLEGELEMTVGTETRTLSEGDAVVVGRGIEHELHSEAGCAFFEALAPVPLDHVPDRDRDLVLGVDGGATHVAS
ncbi:MAG: cupin domain-containing protein [Actinobacteria bacterium]|nr:cupin domain-containing protein [Actinomycetota bacterium]